MPYKNILVEQDEYKVLTITLNRPAVRNALNTATLLELLAVFQNEARKPEARCIVLTGTGAAFCAGQDLEERRAFAYPPSDAPAEKPSIIDSLRQRYNPLIKAMRDSARPIIGAVNGVAAGAGCSLALACDMRLMAENAVLMESFARVGLGMDGGSSYFLPRLVGTAKAFELALTGDKVEAIEAERLGLVNRVVPDAQLMAETYLLARRLAAGAPQALARVKRAFNFAQDATLEQALDYEAILQQDAANGQEYPEGLRAFFEKRPPNFS